jgi:protein O-GlcNAc transferase
MNSLLSAIELYQKGNARGAELACERRLAESRDGDTLSLLAEIHLSTGRTERAVPLLRELTQLRPRDAAAHRRLAGALLTLQQPADAAAVLRAAIMIDPTSARAHNNLGQAMMQLRKVPDAIASYQEALRVDPGYAVAHNNLGLALTAHGESDRAVESFGRAIALDPALAIAEVNLGIVLDNRDRLPEALQAFERALAKAPQLVEAWSGRGTVLAKQQYFAAALDSFDAALRLRPGDAAALAHKASVLLSLERAPDSLRWADEGLRVEPDSAELHNIRAGALRKLGRNAEALHALEHALALNPTYVEAWCNHGMVLHERGDFDRAVRSCRRALELNPDEIHVRTRLLARLIPSVPFSQDEAISARRAFESQLVDFESWMTARTLSDRAALRAAQQQFFYLSYEECSNRSLLERYRGACAARLALVDPLPASQDRVRATSDPASQRFKLGFVSAHVYDHSVFNAILSGWLRCLDRERFEITLFHVGSKQDSLTLTTSTAMDHFETGVRPVADWARAIRDRQFDAVIYPEIGMNETTLALASLRLAQRQFAAWGHPETSGLPTIDGYLSADLFEPPDAQDHYAERLVRLPNLGVHCQPYEIVSAPVDLESLAIPRDCPLFICPGVPFKYRPQDDQIFVEIARRVGRCTFVFFQHEAAELSHKLHGRIAAAFKTANLDPARYLRSISWQPRAAFFGLLRQADVYLDTIGFSGFNTMMQAIECHLPCVTHDGRFMRGRLGSGILRRLGMAHLVAADKENYVDLAVKLAGEPLYRDEIRAEMQRSNAIVYADIATVQALESVLLDSA